MLNVTDFQVYHVVSVINNDFLFEIAVHGLQSGS